MKELKNELRRKEYVDITTLDLEYPPENVLIYLNNLTDANVRVSVQFLDKDIQTQFDNQNPTLIVEDTGEATICLSVEDDSVKPLTCDGAINTVDSHDYVRISQDGLIPCTHVVLKINGEILEGVPSYVEVTQIPKPSYAPPEGYEWLSSSRFSNKSLENVQFEILYQPIDQNQFSPLLENNPTTVLDPKNGRLGFCLSPGEEIIPEIDCTLATPTVKYGVMTTTNEITNPVVKLFIDGVEVNESEEPPPWFSIEDTSEPYPYPIPPGYEVRTVMKFTSKDIVPHTIEIISENDSALPFAYDNPTIVEFSKYHVGFCLLGTEEPQISCDNATDSTGCFNLQGTWDLEINGNIVLQNTSEFNLREYLFSHPTLGIGELCCEMGYYRSIPIRTNNISSGNVVYIPIALTPNGPPITSPITVTGAEWYDLGRSLSNQLNEQLLPHGLTSDWTNNFKEFGVTYYHPVDRREDVKEFYILDEGNTFSEIDIPRGLPPINCYYPS